MAGADDGCGWGLDGAVLMRGELARLGGSCGMNGWRGILGA